MRARTKLRRIIRRLACLALLMVIGVWLGPSVRAQDGVVTTHILGSDYARRGDIQPDGRLVLGGHCDDRFFYAVVYDQNGVLEKTMLYDIATTWGSYAGAYAGATATFDNKIILAGHHFQYSRRGSVGSFALLRYQADGTLDSSFNRGHPVMVDFGKNTSAIQTRVIALPDNSILGIGWLNADAEQRMLLVKFTEAGKLDRSFGQGGKAIDLTNRPALEVNDAVMQNGKILVGGTARTAPLALSDNFHLVVSRFNSDGSRDATFGVNGDVIIDIDADSDVNREAVHRLAVQPDGKILVAGVYEDNGIIVRLTPSGDLDLGFGLGGIVIQDFFPDTGEWGDIEVSQREGIMGIAPLPDGRLAVEATHYVETGPYNSDLLKYNSVLSIYDQYGDLEGWTEGPDGSPREIKLDSLGGIVLMGIVNPPGEYDFWMMRYLVDEEGIYPDLLFGLE